MVSGFGGAPWGASGWGGPFVAPPSLVSAVAVGENVVRLTFNVPMYYSGLLDFPDASSRRRYAFAPVAGTFGMDGTAARAIGAASISVPRVPGVIEGTVLDVTTDRPMTPSPARYVVTCNGLFAADGTTPLSSTGTGASFTSVYKILQPPQVETLTPRGDIAMPQSMEAVQAGLVAVPSSITLGSFVIANGDYATQTGVVEYKERVYRRMITIKDSFLHLAGKKYGAGLLSYGKRLGSAAVRTQLQGDIEQQVGLEPETAACSCKTVPKPHEPGIMLLVLLAKTTYGKPLKVVTPVTSST